MIFIGMQDGQKSGEIARYQTEHGIEKTVVISADEFPLALDGADHVKYSDVIMYVTFYRLLQEINQRTLVVLNEVLRTQNRYDLSYNCIRNFLNLTTHVLIFQRLPLIDTREDFMILFDFDTRSRWKRRPFDAGLVLAESRVSVYPLPLAFERVDVPTSEKTRRRYEAERERLFNGLGKRDPHTLPRNLHLIGGVDKLAYIDSLNLPLFGSTEMYVARNKRLNRTNVITYEEAQAGQSYTLVDFPHRFIDYSDFLNRTGQAQSRALIADLKVDHWYFERYYAWVKRIYDTYTSLQQ
jgi:hypothetical protein